MEGKHATQELIPIHLHNYFPHVWLKFFIVNALKNSTNSLKKQPRKSITFLNLLKILTSHCRHIMKIIFTALKRCYGHVKNAMGEVRERERKRQRAAHIG